MCLTLCRVIRQPPVSVLCSSKYGSSCSERSLNTVRVVIEHVMSNPSMLRIVVVVDNRAGRCVLIIFRRLVVMCCCCLTET